MGFAVAVGVGVGVSPGPPPPGVCVGVSVGVGVGVIHPKHGSLLCVTTIQLEKTPVHSSPVKNILPSAAQGILVCCPLPGADTEDGVSSQAV